MRHTWRPLSILLLTEDADGAGFETLKALVEKMLFLLDPAHDPARVRFEPSTDEARSAMVGNGWKCYKSRNPRDHRKRVDLIKAIATNLLRDDFFVIVHIDGDCVYSESRNGETCDNLNAFRELVRRGVIHFLAERSERIQRLLVLVPFYSIEAWLYQNFEEILEIYKKELTSRSAHDLEIILTWQENRALLDEVHAPKDVFGLKNKYNLRLATTRFPAQKVYDVGKSCTKAVTTLRECDDFMQNLTLIRRHP